MLEHLCDPLRDSPNLMRTRRLRARSGTASHSSRSPSSFHPALTRHCLHGIVSVRSRKSRAGGPPDTLSKKLAQPSSLPAGPTSQTLYRSNGLKNAPSPSAWSHHRIPTLQTHNSVLHDILTGAYPDVMAMGGTRLRPPLRSMLRNRRVSAYRTHRDHLRQERGAPQI